MIEPLLIKAGDKRVLLGALKQPPKLDCRVICEEDYKKLKASEAECKRLEELIDDISGYTDFHSDSYDSDTFSCGQSIQLYLNEELRRQEAKLKEQGR